MPRRSGLSDTDPEIAERLLESYRRMSPEERLRLVLDSNAAAETLAVAGIRTRHGELSDSEMRLHLGALRLGRRTMIEVFGWDPDRPASDG